MVMQIVLWAIVLVMFACVILSVIRTSRRAEAVKSHAKLLMRGRDSLTASQFATRYFPDNFDVAKCVHEILAECIIIDCSKIRPEDLLFNDLGLGQVDGLAAEHFADDVDDELQIDLKPVLTNNSARVRDVINYVADIVGTPAENGK